LSSLSPQELRVLALVAEGKTNKEICTAFGVAEKTVRNQVSNLMRKLAVQRRAQVAAYYVRSSGTLRPC
jgi:two-component system response regulator DevR